MRSQIDDIDLDAGTALIRERKRVRGKLTTRSVPLSPLLSTVLQGWFENHPGGNVTFCFGRDVYRSKKKRELGTELTPDETNDHFKRTLKGSKWEKVRGWHVFRHSFCSNCAAAGIDQRIINAWVAGSFASVVRRITNSCRSLCKRNASYGIGLLLANTISGLRFTESFGMLHFGP